MQRRRHHLQSTVQVQLNTDAIVLHHGVDRRSADDFQRPSYRYIGPSRRSRQRCSLMSYRLCCVQHVPSFFVGGPERPHTRRQGCERTLIQRAIYVL